MDFRLITTENELDGMKKEWNDLLSESITNVPFLRFEYMLNWWKTLGGGEWKEANLAVITARIENRLIGVAPMFQTGNTHSSESNTLMLLGSIEISDYLDLIVRDEDLEEFTLGLFDFLENHTELNWNALDWFNVPEESKSLSFLELSAKKHGWEFKEEPFRPAVSVQLASNFDEYLAGIDKKQRHEIRRKMRRAAEFDLPVSWHIVEDEELLDDALDDFLTLMSFEPEKAKFLSKEMRKQIKSSAQAAWEGGWMQLSFLEIGGQKAAAYLNFDYNDTIWVYNSGMDPRFLDLSPGWVLLGHLLKWANEHGRKVFDFMRGDERYKFKFGGKKHFVQRVQVIR